jgi:hypothetical protein
MITRGARAARECLLCGSYRNARHFSIVVLPLNKSHSVCSSDRKSILYCTVLLLRLFIADPLLCRCSRAVALVVVIVVVVVDVVVLVLVPGSCCFVVAVHA